LNSRPQHQYIVATHSPTIITAANPSTITLVRQTEGESVVEILNAREVGEQRLFLAEVGARPADVFGADNILWVEGPTEEACFPRILERVARRSLMGTVIRGLPNTGDLEGKHDDLVFRIYAQLGHAKSLLPPAIGFILDEEGRSDQRKRELVRRSNNLVHFLEVRMYENYLLNSAAIVHVANGIEGFRDLPITEDEVERLIEQKRIDVQYFRPLEVSFQAIRDDWSRSIHGARVLEDIFSELSETRVAFDKITHSVALTDWLISHSPESFAEVVELVANVLDAREDL